MPSQSFAELVAEEQVDDKWVVNYITENSVHATVNGQVTHGDGLHVRLVKGHCDKGNLLTFVYTYSNHPKIEQLKGSYVTTVTLDQTHMNSIAMCVWSRVTVVT